MIVGQSFLRQVYTVPGQAQDLTNTERAGEGQMHGHLKVIVFTDGEGIHQGFGRPYVSFFTLVFGNGRIIRRVLFHELPLYGLLEAAPEELMDIPYHTGLDEAATFFFVINVFRCFACLQFFIEELQETGIDVFQFFIPDLGKDIILDHAGIPIKGG